jgi:hypothetical protein
LFCRDWGDGRGETNRRQNRWPVRKKKLRSTAASVPAFSRLFSKAGDRDRDTVLVISFVFVWIYLLIIGFTVFL